MTHRRATIKVIARRAGVSITTVSNVFNGKGRFAESTRQRVLQAATDLHFAPNALIRSLQRRKTNIIGVRTWPLEVDPTHNITLHVLKGITEGLAAVGYDMLYYSHQTETPDAEKAISFLDGRVDGMIIGPGILSDAELETLASSRLPAVVLYRRTLPAALGGVALDNIGGIREAVTHLVRLGHRCIAFYAPQTAPDLKERREGYLQGLEAHGIPADPTLCMGAETYHTSVEPACEKLLALPNLPTALIAGDDNLAFQWREALQRRGVRVPEDISLIGFDDAPAASASPGLTTLRQPAQEVGKKAAELVTNLICGEASSKRCAMLPVTLVVRETTAPPPKTASHAKRSSASALLTA